MAKLKLNEIDKGYLDYLKSHNYDQYLSYFISINLGSYVAIYYVRHSSLLILVLLLMFFINTILYQIYTREHTLKDISKINLINFNNKYFVKEIKKLSNSIYNADKPNENITWLSIKALLSFFSSLPIILIIFLLLNPLISCLCFPIIIYIIFSVILFWLYYSNLLFIIIKFILKLIPAIPLHNYSIEQNISEQQSKKKNTKK